MYEFELSFMRVLNGEGIENYWFLYPSHLYLVHKKKKQVLCLQFKFTVLKTALHSSQYYDSKGGFHLLVFGHRLSFQDCAYVVPHGMDYNHQHDSPASGDLTIIPPRGWNLTQTLSIWVSRMVRIVYVFRAFGDYKCIFSSSDQEKRTGVKSQSEIESPPVPPHSSSIVYITWSRTPSMNWITLPKHLSWVGPWFAGSFQAPRPLPKRQNPDGITSQTFAIFSTRKQTSKCTTSNEEIINTLEEMFTSKLTHQNIMSPRGYLSHNFPHIMISDIKDSITSRDPHHQEPPGLFCSGFHKKQLKSRRPQSWNPQHYCKIRTSITVIACRWWIIQ